MKESSTQTGFSYEVSIFEEANVSDGYMSQRSIFNETVLPEARRMVWNYSMKISGNFRAKSDNPKEIQRVDGFDYRKGKIVCITQKPSGSVFWTKYGYAEIEQERTYSRRPLTGTLGKFKEEQDAKKEFIEAAKKWIDKQIC